MSKSKPQKPPKKELPYPYPSRFGSHKSMVVEDCGTHNVICEDEFGKYLTERNRLDNGLADPNRYWESRIRKLFEKRKED